MTQTVAPSKYQKKTLVRDKCFLHISVEKRLKYTFGALSKILVPYSLREI